MKKLKICAMATLLSILAASQSFAGQWFKDNGKWAYRQDDGQVIRDGWFRDTDGSRYYFNGGVVSHGPKDINGKHYYFDNDSGKSLSGWVNHNGSWYFYNYAGLLQTGWIYSNGNWYYTNTDGKMVDDTMKDIGGESYYFNTDGHMAHGEWVKDGTYYANADGSIAKRTWVDGTYVDSKGKVKDTDSDDEKSHGKKKIDNKTFSAEEYSELARDSVDRYRNEVEEIYDGITGWREQYNEDKVYNYTGDDDEYIEKNELPEFDWDDELNYAASLRAVELASCQRASGSRPDGRSMDTIATDLGIDAHNFYESVAFGFDSGEDCYEELESNSSHTKYWKDVNYSRMGIGVACDADGKLFYVVLYAN